MPWPTSLAPVTSTMGAKSGVDPPELCPQNRVFDHGNGGVTGIVPYSTTRAENDPRWGGAEVWEPGIPGVRVQLWDVTRTKLLNEVTTDSWDDSLPTGCQGPVFTFRARPRTASTACATSTRCGPASSTAATPSCRRSSRSQTTPTAWLTPVADRGAAVPGGPTPAGKYIVKMIVPTGYKVVGEEDKNVDFGHEFIPQQFLLTGYSLGDGGPSRSGERTSRRGHSAGGAVLRRQPARGAGGADPVPRRSRHLRGPDARGVRREAGDPARRPEPRRELLPLHRGAGGRPHHRLRARRLGQRVRPELAAVRREVRAAVHARGGPRLDRAARSRGPITTRTARYNVLVPSTFTANVPAPSGMSAQHADRVRQRDRPARGRRTPDPHFNPKYSHFCYTLQYMPGTTTYLDTPVLPTGAFAGGRPVPGGLRGAAAQAHRRVSNGVPTIYSVNKTSGGVDPSPPRTSTG